jgi:hypothetical protein
LVTGANAFTIKDVATGGKLIGGNGIGVCAGWIQGYL